jgi:hypothetical protein
MIEPFHGMDDVVVAPSAVILAKPTLPLSSPSLKNSIRPKFPKREKIPVRHCGTPYKSEAETWP